MADQTKDGMKDECVECRKRRNNAQWHKDFPVTWESDNYVTRREMVKFLTLGSLTIAGANAVVAGLPRVVKASEMPRTQVALASAIPVGGSHLFAYPAPSQWGYRCVLTGVHASLLRRDSR